MARKYKGDAKAVDRTVAAAIQALDSFKEPEAIVAFEQIGYVMRALWRWARERARQCLQQYDRAEP